MTRGPSGQSAGSDRRQSEFRRAAKIPLVRSHPFSRTPTQPLLLSGPETETRPHFPCPAKPWRSRMLDENHRRRPQTRAEQGVSEEEALKSPAPSPCEARAGGGLVPSNCRALLKSRPP